MNYIMEGSLQDPKGVILRCAMFDPEEENVVH